jgi:signal transduction histidine kinase
MDGSKAGSLKEELDLQKRLLDEAQAVGRTGAWQLDPETGLLRWTLGLRRLLELPDSTETVSIEQSFKYYTKSSEAIVREAFQATITRGVPYDLELEALTARGNRLWVREVCRAVMRQGRLVTVYGVLQDITERRRLAQFLAQAVDDERMRIGTELHDGVGQELTGLALLSQAAARRAQEQAPGLVEDLERIAQLASRSTALIRDLSHSMLPFALREGGFRDALEALADSTMRTFAVEVTVGYRGYGAWPSGARAEQLYRIAKEAIMNSLNHGRARRIRIIVRREPEKTALAVIDDGVGFDMRMKPTGMGLSIMHHRARMLGGLLEVRSSGRGTLVRVIAPQQEPVERA